ncbi:hypothetical protein [Pantoea allii]|uniref:hypothetical protein n=1 Tax=Pantoea allii TaxID=574096 RepID=UPI00397742C2
MLKTTLSFTARVGGIVLLMYLCWSQAQPLVKAAFAVDQPAMDWVILVYLVLIGTACALTLPLVAALIVYCLICSLTDVLKQHLKLFPRVVALFCKH